MSYLRSKFISYSPSKSLLIIRKSGLSIQSKKSIQELKDSAYSKNKSTFKQIKKIINGYLSKQRKKNTLVFNCNQLWEVADSNHPINTLTLLIEKEQELLTCFQDISDLIRISKKRGAYKVFTFILNREHLNKLLTRLDSEGILRIANQDSASQVFELIVNDTSFKQLVDSVGIESLIQISSHNGSRQVLDLILQPDSFSILLSRLGKENFIKIANTTGSRSVLNYLEDTSSYTLLISRLGKEGLLKVAKRKGARNVFSLILDTAIYTQLSKQLGEKEIIKIAGAEGARQVFNLILEKKDYNILKNQIGEYAFNCIAKNNGSRQIFNFFLENDNFSLLREHFTIDEIVRIASNVGSKSTLELLLNKDSRDILLDRLGHKSILIDVCSHIGSRQVLDLFINKEAFSRLLQRLGENILIKFSCQDSAVSILKMILIDSSWAIIVRTLNAKTLTQLCTIPKYRFGFIHMVKNYYTLSKYLSHDALYKFSLLSPKNILGTTSYCLEKLLNSFHFNETEILYLAKLSGRFFTDLINQFDNHSSYIESLFVSPHLPLLPSKKRRIEESKRLDNNSLCFIRLAEINQYCLNHPLSIDELTFLKDMDLPGIAPYNRIIVIKKLLQSTGMYTVLERKILWDKLFYLSPFSVNDFFSFQLEKSYIAALLTKPLAHSKQKDLDFTPPVAKRVCSHHTVLPTAKHNIDSSRLETFENDSFDSAQYFPFELTDFNSLDWEGIMSIDVV